MVSQNRELRRPHKRHYQKQRDVSSYNYSKFPEMFRFNWLLTIQRPVEFIHNICTFLERVNNRSCEAAFLSCHMRTYLGKGEILPARFAFLSH